MTTHQRIALYTEAYARWLKRTRDNMPEAFIGPQPDWKEYGLDEWTAGKIREQAACEIGKELRK